MITYHVTNDIPYIRVRYSDNLDIIQMADEPSYTSSLLPDKLKTFEYFRGSNECPDETLQVLANLIMFFFSIILLQVLHEMQAICEVVLEIDRNKMETKIESIQAAGDCISITEWLSLNPENRHHATYPSPDISPYTGELFDLWANDETELDKPDSRELYQEPPPTPICETTSPTSPRYATNASPDMFTSCTVHDMQDAEVCKQCDVASQTFGRTIPPTELPTISIAYPTNDPTWSDVDNKEHSLVLDDMDYETIPASPGSEARVRSSPNLCENPDKKRLCRYRGGHNIVPKDPPNSVHDSPKSDSTIVYNCEGCNEGCSRGESDTTIIFSE